MATKKPENETTRAKPDAVDLPSRVGALESRIPIHEQALEHRIQEAEARVARAEAKIQDLAVKLAKVEAMQGEMARHTPRLRQRLTSDEVKDRIADDSTARFEVIEAYARGPVKFAQGRKVTAQLYPSLASHVRNGLALVPAAAR